MARSRAVLALLLGVCTSAACDGGDAPAPRPAGPGPGRAPAAPAVPMPWDESPVLGEGETFALSPSGARRQPVADARAEGLLDVDLSDGWAPFIFSESDPLHPEAKPQFYRQTYVDLANDRVDPDALLLDGPTHPLPSQAELEERKRKEREAAKRGRKPAEPRRVRREEPVTNFLEVFGIPPTLSVLARRVEQDARKTCWADVDLAALQAWDGEVTYQNPKLSQREHRQAMQDADWFAGLTAASDAGAPGDDAGVAADPKVAARLARHERGQRRLRAVKAAQARLSCEGLLSPRSRYAEGVFDLPTHEALAQFERKNDVFGWGFLGGDTTAALARAPADLHLETFRRILQERVADAAAILEDGSVSGGKRPATYTDEGGQVRPVPNLIADHVTALLSALHVSTPADLARLLRTLGPEGLARFHVAIVPPPLPPYYGCASATADAGAPATTVSGCPELDLQVQIDRGDIWYDFPFDAHGKAIEQRRERYPHLTVFVRWGKQRIPLARWRTTIGSWRSEMHRDGQIYYKYKNSDVGPRIWRNIVAAPVWIPPEGTPTHDLLTRRVFDRQVGPQTIVNTEVMGPGFQSAYGLVFAIHHKVTPGGGLFDNQIRTHGSVDYTSIARRFSHGCHRLVNTRAVRLFGMVLRRKSFVREGNQVISMRRRFMDEGKPYGYEMTTRGYWYRLERPVPVEVLEGRAVGKVQKPITAYVRKPGVDYASPADDDAASDDAEQGSLPPSAPSAAPAVETAPSLGP